MCIIEKRQFLANSLIGLISSPSLSLSLSLSLLPPISNESTIPSSHFVPSSTMIYTDIQTLRGLDKPVDYGSGIEYANGLIENFASASSVAASTRLGSLSSSSSQLFGLQVGLWLNGTQGCDDILDGTLNDNVETMFRYFIVDVPSTVKIFLRIGYEFDNPYFGYSEAPNSYREAYRYLVDYCTDAYGLQACRQKVAFVWHSWAAPRTVESLDEFYPGNNYVDWIGVSIFQQFYPWANDDTDDGESDDEGNFSGGSIRNVQEVLEYARDYRHKPIMIAESTPFGGIFLQDVDPAILAKYGLSSSNSSIQHLNTTNSATTSVSETPVDVDIWSLWFQPVLAVIAAFDIGMWSSIDCDWNNQPMWNKVGFGDTRLASSSYVMKQWHEYVLSNPRFLRTLQCEQDKNKMSTNDQTPQDRRGHQHHAVVKEHRDEQYQQIPDYYRHDNKNKRPSLFSFWNENSDNSLEMLIVPTPSSSSSSSSLPLDSSGSSSRTMVSDRGGGEDMTHSNVEENFVPILIGFVLLILSVATTVHLSTKFGLMVVRKVAEITTGKRNGATASTFTTTAPHSLQGHAKDEEGCDNDVRMSEEGESLSFLGRQNFNIYSNYGSMHYPS